MADGSRRQRECGQGHQHDEQDGEAAATEGVEDIVIAAIGLGIGAVGTGLVIGLGKAITKLF